ncbi:MAG: aminopeptidase P family protein [Burkholderiales bacterium]|nr:aminopeptidase P family protein [Burkholderiales bacterium]
MAVIHRRLAVRRRLQEAGASYFLGVTGASHFFLDTDPVIALGGFRAMAPAAVLLKESGETWLLVTPAWDAARAARKADGAEIEGVQDSLAAAVAALLERVGCTPAQLLCHFDPALPSGLLRELTAAVGTGARRDENLVALAGAVRTADELASVQQATELAELLQQRLLEIIRPGMRECDLAARLLHHARKLGSPDNFFLISASQHNVAVKSPTTRVLDEGDILLAEITPMIDDQFSQICRTVVLGPRDPLICERFDLLKAAFEHARRQAVPGRRMAEVAAAANEVIAGAGFGAFCKPPYMRVRGHGLGNISGDPGDVGTDNPIRLDADMVFVLHPNQYFPDVGYLMCGDPVRVGPSDGAQVLARADARLEFVTT